MQGFIGFHNSSPLGEVCYGHVTETLLGLLQKLKIAKSESKSEYFFTTFDKSLPRCPYIE